LDSQIVNGSPLVSVVLYLPTKPSAAKAEALRANAKAIAAKAAVVLAIKRVICMILLHLCGKVPHINRQPF
jgi:hypothetical protein